MVISGKKIAKDIENKLQEQIQMIKGRLPKLSVLLVGDDLASQSYVRSKAKSCKRVGILSETIRLAKTATTEEVLAVIDKLNCDDSVDAILVQLPLPRQINTQVVLDRISLEKDVDGFNTLNVGKLHLKKTCIVPCTPKGIMTLIESVGYDLSGKNACVVGRSNLVGRPIAELLLAKDATVTICHSKTKNLAEITSKADLLVVAVGKGKLINKDFVKKGAFVIDVGTSHLNGKLVGDCDFDDLVNYVNYITPVPGGVGPMTIVSLLENTYELYQKHQR